MDTYNNETVGGYTPAQPMPKKKKSKALPVFGALLGAVILLVGVFSLLGGLQQHKTANMADTPYDDLSTLTRYYANVMVVDHIGTMTEGDTEMDDYYLGIFTDGDLCRRYCAIRVEQDSPVYAKMKEYAEDRNALIGDLQLIGYYKIEPISATQDLTDTVNDALDEYDDIIRTQYKNIQLSTYTLEWIAGTEEEYVSAEKTKSRSAIFGGVLFAVIGLGLLIPAVLKIRRINAENKAAEDLPDRLPTQTFDWNDVPGNGPTQTFDPAAMPGEGPTQVFNAEPRREEHAPQNPYAPQQPQNGPSDGSDPV